jgi:uncharacterized membrane protein YedE/YeeE
VSGIVNAKLGPISMRHAWMMVWSDWSILFAIGIACLLYFGRHVTVHGWAEYLMASLVVLSGPSVFLRLYSRGVNFTAACFLGCFAIVGLGACALMFATLSA